MGTRSFYHLISLMLMTTVFVLSGCRNVSSTASNKNRSPLLSTSLSPSQSLSPSPTNPTGRILYVDQLIGNDSISYAQNSELRPWATIGRAAWGSANRDAPVASEAAQAGDLVIVNSGTYLTPGTGTRFTPALNPVNSGAAGNYITFQARGVVNLGLSSSNGPVIGANNRHFIIWDGFIVDETISPPHSDTGPLTTLFSSNVIFRNNEVRGIAVDYIDNHNAIRIEESTDVLIENNRLHGIRRPDDSHNAAAIMLYAAHRVTIQNNEIYNSNAAIFPKGLDNNFITIRYNLIHHNGKGIRTSFSITNGRVYQNMIRDCVYPLSQFRGIGIQIADKTQNYIFANNTINNCDSGVHVGVITLWLDNMFQNNLVTNARVAFNAGEVPELPTFTADHNAYYGFDRFTYAASNKTFDQWKVDTGFDANSVMVDPLYYDISANIFTLSPSSSVLRTGVDLLDLNQNGSTSDRIPVGAYVTGNEVIGIER